MKKEIKHLKTLKLRVKDKHAKLLKEKAMSVNYVFNYVNDLSNRSIVDRGKFLSRYDIHKYLNGSSKILGLDSQSIQAVADEYVIRRNQFKKNKLKWRVSFGSKRSLGYIPFKKGRAIWKNGQVLFNGKYFGVFDSYGLSQYEFRNGTFNEDARGRWYFNVVVEVKATIPKGQDRIGIDLGLADTATCSNGEKLESGRFYRGLEKKLAVQQRAKNKKRVRAIHAKIANRRKDALHKFSRKLVDSCGEIYVGDVKSLEIIKTNKSMAKSVLDAGWYQLKTMLEYKCDNAGIVFEVVDERYTTQTCSCCGEIPINSPKGRTGLGVREWTCRDCGAVHDRDINAAKNILAVGLDRLVVGIPVL